jgi:hypothetical protein
VFMYLVEQTYNNGYDLSVTFPVAVMDDKLAAVALANKVYDESLNHPSDDDDALVMQWMVNVEGGRTCIYTAREHRRPDHFRARLREESYNPIDFKECSLPDLREKLAEDYRKHYFEAREYPEMGYEMNKTYIVEAVMSDGSVLRECDAAQFFEMKWALEKQQEATGDANVRADR